MNGETGNMSKEDMIRVLRQLQDVITIGAMAVETTGRVIRVMKGGEAKADKGLVMSAQALYSIAYGIKDFKEKLEGVKYAKKKEG